MTHLRRVQLELDSQPGVRICRAVPRSVASSLQTCPTCALQLDNVLLHDTPEGRPMVRLCDFGSSKLDALNTVCRSYTGTYEYMAPEVLFESQVR